MDVSQSAAYIHSLTYENGFLAYAMDIPKSNSPLWLLGVNYSVLYDLEDIKLDITSRLWFTYRRGFTPIDGKGPISDNGWGCMLRCGQMMLGQALLNRHIGRDWRWNSKNSEPKYNEILKCFLDRKESCFSIHQIACMGVSEGKKIGSWFGPNTIAQVLRKLAVYDDWSNLVVHVAMDNTIVTNDIKAECRCKCRDSPVYSDDTLSPPGGESSRSYRRYQTATNATYASPSSAPSQSSSSPASASLSTSCCVDGWRPLLLMIPLRLGLSEVNEVYYEALKFCLSMPQSVGIIGGKPNHAFWFIGHIDNYLLYLDPHMTQNVIPGSTSGSTGREDVDGCDWSDPAAASEEDCPPSRSDDSTYHCNHVSHMNISDMDPSLAVGFYCHSEAQFDDWQRAMNRRYDETKAAAMFEVIVDRPKHWPSIHCPDTSSSSTAAELSEENRQYDSTDDEFELI